jgi:hypothetical protein
LAATHDAKIVDELLEAYEESKRNYYLGGHRLSEVEGGRFCEAAFRILQIDGKLAVTPLGRQVRSERVIADLAALASGSAPDSVRLHIPRALRLVYDIRNNRDAAHLSDGIDPNVQDSTLVIGVIDWVLAELVRLHHNIAAVEAQLLVDGLVTRAVPVIQEFGDFKKVLRPDIGASDHMLVLLYAAEPAGATYAQLDKWARPEMRANLRRTLSRLEANAMIHEAGGLYRITRRGMRDVETRRLFNE